MSNNFLNRINKLEQKIPERKPGRKIPQEVFIKAVDDYNKANNKNITVDEFGLMVQKGMNEGVETLSLDELVDVSEILDRVKEIEHLS